MKRRIVLALVGLLILVILFYETDFYAVLDAIKGINILLFMLAALSYFVYNLLMAFRLSYLLDKMGKKVDFSHSFLAHLGGMLASDVTPGRAGFFLVPYFLKNRTGCTISEGMAAILAPQGIEFTLKAIGGFIGLLFFMIVIAIDIGTDVLVPLCIGGIAFLGAGIAMLWILWTEESYSTNLFAKIPYINKFKQDFDKMKEKSFSVRQSIYFILLIYFICWVLLGVQWQLIGLSLGISMAQLSFLAYFLLHPLITLLRFVPLTISGLGLMEGATVVMFYLLGIGMPIGLSFSLLVRLNLLLVDSIGLRGVFS